MAQLHHTVVDVQSMGSDFSVGAIQHYFAEERRLLAQACRDIAAKRPDDPLAGKVCEWGVADGAAVYIVKSSSPLVLIHVRIGDCYQIHGAHLRGLRLKDIQRVARTHNPEEEWS